MHKRYNISLQEISKRSIRTPISVKYNRNIILLQGGEFMDARNNDFDFDFTPIGQAIKKARTAKGMTREQLARIVDYDPRHLQAIENEGQKPSLELFIQLVTMFGVSVDEYIFPDNALCILPNIICTNFCSLVSIHKYFKNFNKFFIYGH